MKKRIVMFLVAAMAAIGAWAETETVGSYEWTYQINGDTAEIYNNGNCAVSPNPTGAVTIPSLLGGKPVTRIGTNAFYNCSGLTSMTIPNSVTNIGERAFCNCSGLTSITIPDTVTSIATDISPRSRGAFYGCSGLRDVTVPQLVCNWNWGMSSVFPSAYQSITKVVISDSVTNIVDNAFAGCTNLTSLVMPDSLTSLVRYPFDGCSGLRDVVVPQLVCNERMSSVFWSAYQSITNVVISDSVTNIANFAFSGCSGLTSVTIPDGVTSIGSSAFYGCSGLTSVMIPDSVKSIGTSAFYGCSGLANANGFVVVRNVLYSYYGADDAVTIPDDVTSIGDSAFSGCSGLTSVTIPDDVTSIGDSAFFRCSGLTSVTIGNGVTNLSSTAFDGCGKLWTAWYRTLANVSASGGGSASVITTVVQQVESPYALTNAAADRAIASITVDDDMALDAFVLKDGKVYDCVLYVNNTADHSVRVTLPSGNTYQTFKGASPLTLPAYSTSILTITRVAGGNAGGNVFLVTREELETIQ